MYTIIAEETGAPLRRFLRDVPNDGLIRFRHMFNTERVLIASPKALAEVLVTKNYEFVKPRFFRDNLGRLLGNGILFAEGDEHKVRCHPEGSIANGRTETETAFDACLLL
jgi:hypothetical protein